MELKNAIKKAARTFKESPDLRRCRLSGNVDDGGAGLRR
ncbi:hypothetical protein UF75_4762 [Desulfosporosinus sp. I2]|nr:hypothetical protein UF75_4762 [Desulfosporosinus sp. I2]